MRLSLKPPSSDKWWPCNYKYRSGSFTKLGSLGSFLTELWKMIQIGSCFIPFYSSTVLILHSIWHRVIPYPTSQKPSPAQFLLSMVRIAPNPPCVFPSKLCILLYVDSFMWFIVLPYILCEYQFLSLHNYNRTAAQVPRGIPKSPNNYLIFPPPLTPFRLYIVFLCCCFFPSLILLSIWVLFYDYLLMYTINKFKILEAIHRLHKTISLHSKKNQASLFSK